MMIPFVDLNAQYLSIKSEIDNAIKDCIEEANFIKGEAVSDFEKVICGLSWYKILYRLRKWY